MSNNKYCATFVLCTVLHCIRRETYMIIQQKKVRRMTKYSVWLMYLGNSQLLASLTPCSKLAEAWTGGTHRRGWAQGSREKAHPIGGNSCKSWCSVITVRCSCSCTCVCVDGWPARSSRPMHASFAARQDATEIPSASPRYQSKSTSQLKLGH